MAWSGRLQALVVRGAGIGLIGLVTLILVVPKTQLTHLTPAYVFVGVIAVITILALTAHHPRIRALTAGLTQHRCDRIAFIAIPVVALICGAFAAIDPPIVTWDPHQLLVDAGVPLSEFSRHSLHYFERYPNNHPVFALARVVYSLSETGIADYRTIFAIINSISFAVALGAGYLIARKLGRPALGIASIPVITLIVGLSPNFAIAYTDALTLAVATSVIALLLWAADSPPRSAALFAGAAGIVCAVGYLLKTTPIVSLAGALIGLAFLAVEQASRKTALVSIAALAAAFVASVAISHPIVNKVAGLEHLPNTHSATPPICYVYDGMTVTQLRSDRSVTVYGGWDAWRDRKTEGRTTARQSTICQRGIERILGKRGVVNTTKFYVDKAEFLMGDGTFFAYGEGVDIKRPPLRHNFFAQTVDSFYGHEGSLYRAKNYLAQIAWTVVLILIGVGLLRTRVSWPIFMMVLPLVGIGVFEEIFQSRARYLYSSAPLFIILGMLVLPEALARIQFPRKTNVSDQTTDNGNSLAPVGPI